MCKELTIIINSPIKLDQNTSYLYDHLKKFGYNLFNDTDAFYTDICSIYTSEKGTDMILSDRRKEIFLNNGNILGLLESFCLSLEDIWNKTFFV